MGKSKHAVDKKKVFVILNGKKCGDADFRTAISHLRDQGHEVNVRVTYENGCTERFVEEALAKDDIDVIVTAGGDGSVNQLAGALVKADAPKSTAIAVIPMGTANDFATAAGIPSDPWEALQLAVHDTAFPVDVGLVNDEVFMNVATGGFGTEITAQTDEGLKDRLGGAAYLLTGISKPGSVAARKATGRVPLKALTKVDGKYEQIKIGEDSFAEVKMTDHGNKQVQVAEFSGDLLVLAVGLSRQAGGGHQLCPDAILDDGLFDVSYVLNISPEKIPTILSSLFDGSSSTIDDPETFGHLRCDWLEVDCPDELQVNRDGEPMRDTSFKFKLLPRRLKLHLPDRTLLAPEGSGSGNASSSNQKAAQHVSRSSPQAQFAKKLSSFNRPQFESKRSKSMKQVAMSTAKLGLVFGAGGVVGVWAHRRGWLGGSR